MQIDVKTVSIEPERKTFDHLARRFGDKQPTRYQEGSYDIQATENLHYRPTWDPEQALYDPDLSRVRMQDWHDLKDPRQYYYHTYTITRARQQDTAEANFEFVESRDLCEMMPEDLREMAAALLMPLRHVAWAGNQNNTFICGYGYGVPFTQPALYYAMDCLGIAQYLTRLGLLLGGTDALEQGKQDWLQAHAWQAARHFAEDSMAIRDPVESFLAWNVAFDGLLYPMIYEHIVDTYLSARGAAAVAMLTQFMSNWFNETQKWVNAVVKVAAAESDENKQVMSEWYNTWSQRAVAAQQDIVAIALGEDAADVVTEYQAALTTRMQKNGLAI